MMILQNSISNKKEWHTFCIRMAERGMNPKTLQYLMGHADITVTLNVYTHASYTKVADEMEQITAV